MKNKVIITGGLGFIFSYVTEYFVKKGYEVVVYDALYAGSNDQIVDGSFKLETLDLCSDKIPEMIFKENPDYIVHAAAITDVDYSLKNPKLTLENNIISTTNVFEGARKARNLKKFLYVNTDEVYGECDHSKTEEEIMFPRNPYAASKAMGAYVRTSYDTSFPEFHEKTTEIRMCNIFGDRQDTTKIMPQIKLSLAGKHKIPLQNEGVGYREYLYVENIPPLIELVLQKGYRVYNITNQEGMTVNELIQKSEELTDRKCETYPANRLCHDLQYKMDNARIKELGWKPEFTLNEGLQKYIKTLKSIK